MKELTIISEGVNTGLTIEKQLISILYKDIKINRNLVCQLKKSDIDPDLVLFTSTYVKNRSIKYLNPEIPYIVANRIIDHKNIKNIISIEEGKSVLFINDSYESANEAIEQLIDLGLDHIKYHPYYPDCTSYPKLEMAITAGESQLAPYKPHSLIDIGTRILDVQTIHKIVIILNVEKDLDQNLIVDYIRDIVEITKSIDESRRRSLESQNVLETVVNSLDSGVGFIDSKGIIKDLNYRLEHIIGRKRNNIIGKNISEILGLNLKKLSEGKTYISKDGDKELHIEITKVGSLRRIVYILWVKSNLKSKPKTNHPNGQVINKNLHTFKDYYTINQEGFKMIKKAKKFAKTDLNILIEGENGTGKEILAQGIHMNSFRKDNVFVPINMTTISANLLESELFGYEEGAFTGALKRGKRGLFEMADGGTIFIDEIGDTPLEVQPKLLRVLEEKRIRKIGGMREIPIDVRIIAATNKNLLKLVEQGKFRLDLFFRLNILPLQTIPLRHRREDIEYLLKYFLNINLKHKKIDSLQDFFEEDTVKFLIDYKWIGNVRELINLLEYLILIYDGEKIKISALHNYMINIQSERESIYLSKQEVWVLRQIFNNDPLPIGRMKIAQMAVQKNIKIGEGKIRSIIDQLNKYRLIKKVKNKGSIVTKLGNEYMKKI